MARYAMCVSRTMGWPPLSLACTAERRRCSQRTSRRADASHLRKAPRAQPCSDTIEGMQNVSPAQSKHTALALTLMVMREDSPSLGVELFSGFLIPLRVFACA
eukprot:2924837-Rhodomonas_salina.1